MILSTILSEFRCSIGRIIQEERFEYRKLYISILQHNQPAKQYKGLAEENVTLYSKITQFWEGC